MIGRNLEVIKTADWILDLGPGCGDGGGEIVAAGTPEAIANEKLYRRIFARGAGAQARGRAEAPGGERAAK